MSRQTLQEFCTTQKRPELLVEWDLERNAPLTPKDVTFGSHKKVWWCCKNGHSWQTAVYTRSGGAGCPYCSGRLPHIERSKVLSQYAPALVKEWDSEKNAPLTPSCFDAAHQKGKYHPKHAFANTPKALIHLCFLYFYYTTLPPWTQ